MNHNEPPIMTEALKVRSIDAITAIVKETGNVFRAASCSSADKKAFAENIAFPALQHHFDSVRQRQFQERRERMVDSINITVEGETTDAGLPPTHVSSSNGESDSDVSEVATFDMDQERVEVNVTASSSPPPRPVRYGGPRNQMQRHMERYLSDRNTNRTRASNTNHPSQRGPRIFRMTNATSSDDTLPMILDVLRMIGGGASASSRNSGLSQQDMQRVMQVYTFNSDETQTCPITHTPFARGDRIARLTCEHEFNEEAITQWLATHSSCPVCRRNF